MFFHRKRPAVITFEARLDALRRAGFETLREPDGRIMIRKHGCAAMIADGQPPRLERAGMVVGDRIAFLVDEGYQKFWAAGERRIPALASQLQAVHEFEEDVREALGVESLYNESLGTTNDMHHYDRLEGR
jgi:hypothetical protein